MPNGTVFDLRIESQHCVDKTIPYDKEEIQHVLELNVSSTENMTKCHYTLYEKLSDMVQCL